MELKGGLSERKNADREGCKPSSPNYATKVFAGAETNLFGAGDSGPSSNTAMHATSVSSCPGFLCTRCLNSPSGNLADGSSSGSAGGGFGGGAPRGGASGCVTLMRMDNMADAEATENMEKNEEAHSRQGLLYGVTSKPPLHIIIIYSLQLFFSNIGGTLACVYLVHANLCADNDDVLFADLLATAVFMGGLCTLMQTTLGTRLPIYQGSARSFIPVLSAVMLSKQHACNGAKAVNLVNTSLINAGNSSAFNENVTDIDSNTVGDSETYKVIINEVSGSLALASCFQVLCGLTGIIGAVMSIVGPITITPVVAMIGFELIISTIKACQHHWGIAFLTMALVYLFSIVMEQWHVPIPTFAKQHNGKRRCCVQIFAMGIAWILCGILTAMDYFPPDKDSPTYRARTDAKISVLSKVSWFSIPYPGKYGMLSCSLGTTMGFLSAIIASIVDTAGDYYATSRACREPPPPAHALNRGIFIDGVGRVLSGLVGACHATSSYSTPIGFIPLTGVGSRRVWQFSGVLFLVTGAVGKITGCLSLVPDPVIGGLAAVGIMVLIGVGLSNLYCVDLNSTRNQVVLGTSLALGLMIPSYIKDNLDSINTGAKTADDVIIVILSNGMLLSAAMACLLDNVLPGTLEERGMIAFKEGNMDRSHEVGHPNEELRESLYDFPVLNDFLRKASWTRYIPISPTFKEGCCTGMKGACTRRNKGRGEQYEGSEEIRPMHV